jgi:acylphosphatase
VSAPGRVGFRVTGRVQGVGFRWFVARLARELGLAGGVRNTADGAVIVEVAGADGERLAALRRGLERGPAAARVDRVEPVAAAGGPMDLEFAANAGQANEE